METGEKRFSIMIGNTNVAELIEKQLDDIFENVDLVSVHTEMFL